MVQVGKRHQLLPLVETVATRYKIDAKLLDAIVTAESAYNPYAVRYEPNYNYITIPDSYAKNNRISIQTEKQCQKISWGLGQIMGGTARFIGYGGPLTQLVEPELNLTYVCKYLLRLANEYPHVDDQIAAYNAGSVRKNSKAQYVNQGYVDRVMGLMAR